MKTKLILCALALINKITLSQTLDSIDIKIGQMKVKGIIVVRKTQLPVEYANIGIFEKGVGTVSNTNGIFDFIIPIEINNNPITVKQLGYKDALVNVTEINYNLTSLKIVLEPSVSELKEVIISATRETNIGYKPNGEQVKGFFKAAGLGLQVKNYAIN